MWPYFNFITDLIFFILNEEGFKMGMYVDKCKEHYYDVIGWDEFYIDNIWFDAQDLGYFVGFVQ